MDVNRDDPILKKVIKVEQSRHTPMSFKQSAIFEGKADKEKSKVKRKKKEKKKRRKK